MALKVGDKAPEILGISQDGKKPPTPLRPRGRYGKDSGRAVWHLGRKVDVWQEVYGNVTHYIHYRRAGSYRKNIYSSRNKNRYARQSDTRFIRIRSCADDKT